LTPADLGRVPVSRCAVEKPDHRHPLLRPRHYRPRCRAPEPRDEFPPSHQRSPKAGSAAYRGRGPMSGLKARVSTHLFLQRGRQVMPSLHLPQCSNIPAIEDIADSRRIWLSAGSCHRRSAPTSAPSSPAECNQLHWSCPRGVGVPTGGRLTGLPVSLRGARPRRPTPTLHKSVRHWGNAGGSTFQLSLHLTDLKSRNCILPN
jgi:hypothetical protein